MVETLEQLFGACEPHLRVFFFSMLPVTELRAALPLGVVWGLSPGVSLLWALAGNFVPVIPLLLLLPWLLRSLVNWPLLGKPLNRLIGRNQAKKEQVRRFGMIGLTLLVAIPLPMTGIWTGCLVAALLSLPFWGSLVAITAGMIFAGILVYLMTNGVIAVTSLQYGEYFLILLFVLLVFAYIYRRKRK